MPAILAEKENPVAPVSDESSNATIRDLEVTVAALERARIDSSCDSGRSLRPVLSRQIDRRSVELENSRRRENSVIVPNPATSTPEPFVLQPQPFFGGSIENLTGVSTPPPAPPSAPFHIYQDLSSQLQQRPRIVVIDTEHSVGQENIPPEFLDQESVSVNNMDDTEPLEENLSEELKSLLADFQNKACLVKSFLQLYKPEKYDAQVLNLQKADWMGKVESSYADLMMVLFKFIDKADSVQKKQELQEVMDTLTTEVNTFCLTYVTKTLTLASVAAASNAAPASSSPAVSTPGASGSSVPSSASSSTLAELERRKAQALVEVNTEKINIDIKSLTKDIRKVDDWSEADNHEVLVGMGKKDGWRKRFRDIQTQMFSIKTSVKTHNLDNEFIRGPEAAVNTLETELEEKICDLEYEDSDRCLYSLAKSKSADVPYPKFHGKDDEDYLKFVREFKEALKSNQVAKSDQVKTLRRHLDGLALAQVPEGLTDITKAFSNLSALYGNASRMMDNKKEKLSTMGKFPKPGSKAAPHLKSQLNWLLQLEILITELVDLTSINTDMNNEVFNPSTLKTLKALFTYEQCEEIANEEMAVAATDTKSKIEALQTWISKKRVIVEGMTRESDKSDKSTKTGGGGGAKTGLFSKSKAAHRNENCRICQELEKRADTDSIYEDHYGNTPYGCPRFARMDTATRASMVQKLRICKFCLDANYIQKKPGDRHQNCPAFAKKQYWTCNKCKAHYLVCLQHVSSNQDKLDGSNRFWTNKGFIFTNTVTVLGVGVPSQQLVSSPSPAVPQPGSQSSSNNATATDVFEDLYEATQKLKTFARNQKVREVPKGDPLFLFSYVEGKTRDLNCFHDLGCSHAMFRSNVPVKELDAVKTKQGPLSIHTAGAQVAQVEDEWACLFPRMDGSKQVVVGVSCPSITHRFPMVDIKKAVEEVIANAPPRKKDLLSSLSCPDKAGGDVDILLGILYASCHPQILHTLPSGLFIAKLKLSNSKGFTAAIGGPHSSFQMMANHVGETVRLMTYFVDGIKSYQDWGAPKLPAPVMTYEDMEFARMMNSSEVASVVGSGWCEEVNGGNEDEKTPTDAAFGFTISCGSCGDDVDESLADILDEAGGIIGPEKMSAFITSAKESEQDDRLFDLKTLMKLQESGLSLEYRCPRCRGCHDCKNAPTTERISLREEREDQAIRDSITIDWERRKITAKLPLRGPEEKYLSSNRAVAEKVLHSQVIKVKNDPEAKETVIKAFQKLLTHGHAKKIEDLSEEERSLMLSKEVQNYLPWRVVFKDSVSTPCRCVFDASSNTPTLADGRGGSCLNNLCMKGKINTLNLLTMLLRFIVGSHACAGDLKQFYCSIALHPSQYNLQRVLWKEGMEIDSEILEMVIVSLIFGVRSVSALSETAVMMLADHVSQAIPLLAEMLRKSRFVDDLAHSTARKHMITTLIEEADKLFQSVGLACKGWSTSGNAPHPDCTHDGLGIDVGGIHWWPQVDSIQVKIPSLHFGKKIRGKLAVGTEVFSGSFADLEKFVPAKLTRRQVVSKFASLFDVLGKLVPVTGAMKVHMRKAVLETTDWDGVLSSEARAQWVKNFWRLEKLRGLQYNRAIIPVDAVDTRMELIAAGDAANDLKICGVWGRFRRSNGEFSSQLILGRSLLVKEDSSIPREELEAMTGASNLLWVVRESLGEWVSDYLLLSDSVISLCWVTTEHKRLSLWHRNRVNQVRFNTPLEKLHWVSTLSNPSDCGTRSDKITEDCVGPHSVWETGPEWMTGSVKDALDSGILKPASELRIAATEEEEYEKGLVLERTPEILIRGHAVSTEKVAKIEERANFSQYIFMPSKFDFKKVVTITALVYKFIRKCGYKMKKVDKSYKNYSATFRTPTSAICWGSERSGEDDNVDKKYAQWEHEDVSRALNYWYSKATREVEHFVKPETVARLGVKKDDVLYCRSRIMDSQRFLEAGNLAADSLGLELGLSMMTPLIERFSPIAYSIALYVHTTVGKHAGYETSYRLSLEYVHILQGPSLFKQIGEQCAGCAKKRKQYLDVVMGPVSDHQLSIVPPFYCAYVDLDGPYHVYVPGFERETRNRKIQKTKCYIMCFVCPMTKLTNLQVLESKNAEGVLEGVMRLACEQGMPSCLVLDQETSFMKMVRDAEVSLQDIKLRAFKEYGIRFEVAPVGGHNHMGLVERKIQTVQKAFNDINLKSTRLHATGLQTFAKLCENDLNNLPLGFSHGRDADTTPCLKMITPNMMKIGRINSRNLAGPMKYPNGPKDYLKRVEDIYNAWYKIWNVSVIPKLIQQPKWWKNSEELKPTDIVYFQKRENEWDSPYTIGEVESVTRSKDGVIRRCVVKYFNATVDPKDPLAPASGPMFTDRAVRSLIRLFNIEDNYFVDEMNQVEKLITSLDAGADNVAGPPRLQRTETGGFIVNQTLGIYTCTACCCAGHCAINHPQVWAPGARPRNRMLSLWLLMGCDDRCKENVIGKSLVHYLDSYDIGEDRDVTLDNGLLPPDTNDDVWRMFTALETKFSLE